MDLSITATISYTYPNAVYSISEDGYGNILFDSWVSTDHPSVPTTDELTAWQTAYEASAVYILANFNSQTAIGREAQVFSGADLIRLAPVSYTINTLIVFGNFWGGTANGVAYSGLQQFLTGLVATGQILQSDYDTLNSVLKEQNIDLNTPLVV